MGDHVRMDIEKCVIHTHDLVQLLKSEKDVNNLKQSLDGTKMLQSYCNADFYEVQNLLQDYQQKIGSCSQRIDEVKGEILSDNDQHNIENDLEEELRKECLLMEEFRVVNEQISDLECQMTLLEDQRKILNKRGKDGFKAQMNLSMYASVTSIVPNMHDKAKISGHIVDKANNMVQKFEFESSNASSVDICNSLWKMVDI